VTSKKRYIRSIHKYELGIILRIGKDEIGPVYIIGLVMVSFGALFAAYGFIINNLTVFVIGAPLAALGFVASYYDLNSYRKKNQEQIEATLESQRDAKAHSDLTQIAMDELKKLKELFDMEAITKEEFEQRKMALMEKI
jgi:hypothetical protein